MRPILFCKQLFMVGQAGVSPADVLCVIQISKSTLAFQPSSVRSTEKS